MELPQLFDYIRDFGFPMILSWYLLVRMESKLDSLTKVIGELSCSIAAKHLAISFSPSLFRAWEGIPLEIATVLFIQGFT